MLRFKRLFGEMKPTIGMVHLDALPGSPLYDPVADMEQLVENAGKDLLALQEAGFDAVLFGNENDRPYQFEVDKASLAAMAYVIGRLKDRIVVPFGVDLLWDPMATVAVASVTGAEFAREIFTGLYASDMGFWSPDAGKAMRYRNRLQRNDVALFFNVSAEFADSLDRRSLADRARSAVFSSIPDAVLVSGQITGESPQLEQLRSVKQAVRDVPVLANTGVTHNSVHEILDFADGCIVGTALKVDGDTWKPVDPERASEFMAIVKERRTSS